MTAVSVSEPQPAGPLDEDVVIGDPAGEHTHPVTPGTIPLYIDAPIEEGGSPDDGHVHLPAVCENPDAYEPHVVEELCDVDTASGDEDNADADHTHDHDDADDDSADDETDDSVHDETDDDSVHDETDDSVHDDSEPAHDHSAEAAEAAESHDHSGTLSDGGGTPDVPRPGTLPAQSSLFWGAPWPHGSAAAVEFSDWCFAPIAAGTARHSAELCIRGVEHMAMPSLAAVAVPDGCLLHVTKQYTLAHILPANREASFPGETAEAAPHGGVWSWADCPSALWPGSHITDPDAETACRHAHDVIEGKDPAERISERSYSDEHSRPVSCAEARHIVLSPDDPGWRCRTALIWARDLALPDRSEMLGGC